MEPQGGRDYVSVWLLGFNALAAPAAVANLQRVFGVDTETARNLTRSLPAAVKQRATPEQARRYLSALREIGAVAELRPCVVEPPLELALAAGTPPPPAPSPPPAVSPAPTVPAGAHPAPAAPVERAPLPRQMPRADARVVAGVTTRVWTGQPCLSHLDREARLYCHACDSGWCPDCVEPAADPQAFHCRNCKVATEWFVEPVRVESVDDYMDQLPATIRFPFRSDVLFLIGVSAVVIAPLEWISQTPGNFYGMVGVVLQHGWEAALYFHLLRHVAFGRQSIPTPDFTCFFEDIVHPLLRYVMATLPIIVALVWLAVSAFGSMLSIALVEPTSFGSATGPLLLLLVGFLLWPLLTIIAAIGQSLWAPLDPREWWAVLRLIGAPFVVGACIFYGLMLLELFVLGAVSVKLYAIPFVGRVMALFLIYCFMAVRARVLGSLLIGRFDTRY